MLKKSESSPPGGTYLFKQLNLNLMASQECPEETADFRSEQCSRFDSQTFEGRYYQSVHLRLSSIQSKTNE